MRREILQAFAWSLLLLGIAAAWITESLAVAVSTFAALSGHGATDLALRFRWIVDAQRVAIIVAAAGVLAILISWRPSARNAPPYLRRLAPYGAPSFTPKSAGIAMAAALVWGWTSVLLSVLMLRLAPSGALPLFVILHAPLAIAASPLQLLMGFLASGSLPSPVAAAYSVMWALGGLILYGAASAYGLSPGARGGSPRR